MRYQNRRQAGQVLAAKLAAYADQPNVLVLALPRGGVPVAFEVAQALRAPLDVFLVRKLGVPGQPELAMGAIATGGVLLINTEVVNALGISDEVIDVAARKEQAELERREHLYRDERPPLAVRDRIVVVVDDGLATGSTMRAVIAALKEQQPARIVVAAPVGAAETCGELQSEVDEAVCAMTPEPFFAVGQWYEDFSQTTDEEVHELLAEAAQDEENAVTHRRDSSVIQ